MFRKKREEIKTILKIQKTIKIKYKDSKVKII